jgi:hypothetical protein
MTELTKRVELVILVDDDGLQVVTERHQDGLLEASTASTLEEARAWVEAHYEAVEWQAPRRGNGLVGRLPSRED